MAADLARYRDRLKVSRRRLVERLVEEDDPNRNIPDTFWLKTCADLQAVLEAVEAVMAEDGAGGDGKSPASIIGAVADVLAKKGNGKS